MINTWRKIKQWGGNRAGRIFVIGGQESCPEVILEQRPTDSEGASLGSILGENIPNGRESVWKDRNVSSMSMASQYDTTSDANNMTSLYTSLSAHVVQEAPSQIPNQEHSLSLPYQGVIQGYYCNQGPLGLLPSGELSPYLQSYGSVVSYMESRTSVPQPELVMVLKEIQPTNVIPPASTSGSYSSVSTQPITQTSFQGEYKEQEGRGISSSLKNRVNLSLGIGESTNR